MKAHPQTSGIHSMPPKPYLTRREAAALLAVGLRTIDKLIACRAIRFAKIGASVRIPADALSEYLSQVTREAQV